MTATRRPAVLLLTLLLAASMAPMLGQASASEAIHLSVDVQHVVLAPGAVANVTLTVTNNGSSIDSFDIEVDNSTLHASWEFLALDQEVVNVFPTWSKNASLLVRLDANALPAHADTVDIVVTEPDSGASSTITVALTVASVYAPRIEASGAGDGGLVVLEPGDVVDVTIPVTNDGNAPDTLLLSVNDAPDLAGFWANWSSSGGSSNVSENNSGASHEVLMMGNSYTSANGLSGLIQGLLREEGDANVSALTGGGMTLVDHWGKVNTSGDSWNTTLSGSSWDLLVLQDQSQIPGFPRSESLWNASMLAGVELGGRGLVEGADIMLMMTWGRQDGDASNAALYPDFSIMNQRLLDGYEDYADNISASNSGLDVYIAPVGLAFEAVYDGIVDAGGDPADSNSSFVALYTSDGSHPSLAGSYLAACTLAASISGVNPVGWTVPAGLNASMGLLLQQAAADAVFNLTSAWTYPWSPATGSSIGPMASTGDDLLALFSDDVLESVGAFSTASATLRLEIAPDAEPGDLGLDLHVASTQGNITSQSTLVVRIQAVPGLSIGNIDPSDILPFGEVSTTSVTVVNTGSSAAEWSWSLEPVGAAACVWDLVDATTSFGGPDESATVGLRVEVPEAAAWPAGVQEVCQVELVGSWSNDSSVEVSRTIGFVIDERVDVDLEAPANVAVDVDEGSTWQATVMNAGSHALDITLALVAPSSGPSCQGRISTSIVDPATATVAAGSTGVWSLSSTVQEAVACAIGVRSTTVHGSSVVDVQLLPADYATLSVTGPSDGRVAVEAGDTSSFEVNLEHDGTLDLDLLFTTQGLPSGVTLEGLPEGSSVLLGPSTPSLSLNLSVVAGTEAAVGSHDLVLVMTDDELGSWTYALEVQITLRRGVDVVPTPASGQGEALITDPEDLHPGTPVIGGLSSVSRTMTVVNTGATEATFVLGATTVEGDGSALVVQLNQSVVTLGSGSSVAVPVHLDIAADGPALIDGQRWQVMLTAVSSTDASVADETFLSVVYRTQSLTIIASAALDEVDAGETLTGTVVVTGRVDDRVTLTATGGACSMPGPVLVDGRTEALPWSCVISPSTGAGAHAINISVLSAVAGSFTTTVDVVVRPSWTASVPLEVVVEETELLLDVEGSTHTVVRVTNTANGAVSGSMTLAGRNLAYLHANWINMDDGNRGGTFTLEAGETVRFKLELLSMKSTSGSAEPEVLAVYDLNGVQRTDSGGALEVTIVGPPMAPAGLDLGFVTLGNRDGLLLIASGWMASLLFFGLLRLRKQGDDDLEAPVEEEVEEEKELPELGHNEARLEQGRVTCPNCDSALGVPAGSEPPFRFSCPRCSAGIRVVE